MFNVKYTGIFELECEVCGNTGPGARVTLCDVDEDTKEKIELCRMDVGECCMYDDPPEPTTTTDYIHLKREAVQAWLDRVKKATE
jgi:hypothetical protein